MVPRGLCAAVFATCTVVCELAAQPAAEPPRQRLVVGSFEEQGVPPGLGDVVADLITGSIDSSKVELVERRQVKRVLDEQAIASSDLTQPGEAVRYGQLAESRFVLLGSVYRVEGLYYVSARIVNIETGIVSEGSRATAMFSTVDEMLSQIPGLVRAVGLCDGCPAVPASLRHGELARDGDSPPSTVQDYLERPGDRSSGVSVSIVGGARRVEVGRELQLEVRSPRAGFLSLFVVDANGAVSMLVPNDAVRMLRVEPGAPVTVPRDAGFKLLVTPPVGMARVKAVVTATPMPLVGSPDAAGVLRRVTLTDSVPASEAAAAAQPQASEWIGGEFEFLVLSPGSPPSAAAARIDSSAPSGVPSSAAVPSTPTGAAGRKADIPVQRAAETVAAALERVRRNPDSPSPDDVRVLQWPLRTPFVDGVDLGQDAVPTDAPYGPCIAVIDADFDPDDPVLARSLRNVDSATKQRLRDEIRRNGAATLRHGNRVASLIAGEAAWLPSVAPGAEIRPIRVTTTIDGPEYRVERGGAPELIEALRSALRSGCRIINLSLSVALEGRELEAFASDRVWSELEDAGILVVCAAGNSGSDLDSNPTFPACLDRGNILCVGAVGPDGQVASWEKGGSSVGPASVDLMAPGVLLAASDGAGRIGLATGTSYASALAAGAAARWLRQEPSLTPAQLIRLLTDTAERTPALTGRCRSGIVRCPN